MPHPRPRAEASGRSPSTPFATHARWLYRECGFGMAPSATHALAGIVRAIEGSAGDAPNGVGIVIGVRIELVGDGHRVVRRFGERFEIGDELRPSRDAKRF